MFSREALVEGSPARTTSSLCPASCVMSSSSEPSRQITRRQTEFQRSQPDRSQTRNRPLGAAAKAPELAWIFTEAFPSDLSVALAGIFQ
jgi:hypothetical protein